MERNLTDLLNSDPAAYEYFYSLSAQVQELLQSRDIHTFSQLKDTVSSIAVEKRPRIF